VVSASVIFKEILAVEAFLLMLQLAFNQYCFTAYCGHTYWGQVLNYHFFAELVLSYIGKPD
jgi:hypothetical protein